VNSCFDGFVQCTFLAKRVDTWDLDERAWRADVGGGVGDVDVSAVGVVLGALAECCTRLVKKHAVACERKNGISLTPPLSGRVWNCIRTANS
jgi:hypothetical protein